MTNSLQDVSRPFSGAALAALLPSTTRLLGLGEPTHLVEEFLDLRNEVFRHLVEHAGYRSIAIESDCLAALVADAYVTDGVGTLDDAMRDGFSHEFGGTAGNRELLRWMRAYNEGRPAHERVHFYGFDGPLEITHPESPRKALLGLHDYLAAHHELPWRRRDIETLLGPDERWSDQAAMLDPTRSFGTAPEVAELRLITDGLHATLAAYAPDLVTATSPDDWWRADLNARTAAGLLRYQVALADTTPLRIGMILNGRETMMASNLEAILRREERRGPVLAFAHNLHLKRDKSRMTLGDQPFEWWSAGAIVGAHLGDRYAVVATHFGTRGADVPGPDTAEGVLSELPHDRVVVAPGDFAAALDRKLTARVPADHTYFSIDPDTLDQTEALVFVKEI